jgi:dynein heavy chain
MFGDYMNPDREPDERVYEEVTSIDSFYSVVEQHLEEYNNVHKTRMNLVVFRYFNVYLPK